MAAILFATPPIALPSQPLSDPALQLPTAPTAPPTVNDIVEADRYYREVVSSRASGNCTDEDFADAIVYKHAIVAQAAAAAQLQGVVPSWFYPAVAQHTSRLEDTTINKIVPELCKVCSTGQYICCGPPGLHMSLSYLEHPNIRSSFRLPRLYNLNRDDGTVQPFEIIPFANGRNPTQPPDNLPPLLNARVVDHLTEPELAAYLTGYGVVPLPVDQTLAATNYLRRKTFGTLDLP